MKMTPKTFIFLNEETGEEMEVIATCLAAATGKLPDDFQWDSYVTHEKLAY
jgi:hypothetical protein